MTSLSGVYMRAPETWPFKTPTIPAKLVPSHKTYAPNNEGLVFVDPCDIATLLGLGFYLYGPSPTIKALLAGLPGAGDPSMFLAMDGVGRTPAGGGGSSGLALISSGTLANDETLDINLPLTGYILPFRLSLCVFPGVRGKIITALSFDGGATFLCDAVNFDSYMNTTEYVNCALSTTSQVFTERSDSVMYLTEPTQSAKIDTPFPCHADAEIDPGSATTAPSMWSVARFRNEVNTTFFTNKTLSVLNLAATVTPTLARATTLRIATYGSGDINIPSGGSLDEGYWSLSAFATP